MLLTASRFLPISGMPRGSMLLLGILGLSFRCSGQDSGFEVWGVGSQGVEFKLQARGKTFALICWKHRRMKSTPNTTHCIALSCVRWLFFFEG